MKHDLNGHRPVGRNVQQGAKSSHQEDPEYDGENASDLAQVDTALAALSQINPDTVAAQIALGYVNNMETGTAFSAETYAKSMSDMINDDMYWGDDFDQQQAYVDVYHVYAGLRDRTMSNATARLFLSGIRDGQLLPWLEEDLTALQDQWHLAALKLPGHRGALCRRIGPRTPKAKAAECSTMSANPLAVLTR